MRTLFSLYSTLLIAFSFLFPKLLLQRLNFLFIFSFFHFANLPVASKYFFLHTSCCVLSSRYSLLLRSMLILIDYALFRFVISMFHLLANLFNSLQLVLFPFAIFSANLYAYHYSDVSLTSGK